MSFETIYIETEILDDKRVLEILQKLNPKNVIEIKKYTDVFNRKNQDFRQQKESGQKLIIASKRENFVQLAPEKCKLGIADAYYFSHLYNCPFDCEYCYLQGNYRSAYFVWFVNYADYFQEIRQIVQENKKPTYFFSGFDCDSLALEGITNFATEFIPFFETLENASLELRTKSVNITVLQKMPVPRNAVIAWTLSPQEIQEVFEKKTASLEQRINALNEILSLGWRVGIRLEPMLYVQNWEDIYGRFFEELVQKIDLSKIEDISVGTLHLPKEMYKKMRKILPKSKLYTGPFELDEFGEMRYFEQIDEGLKNLALVKLSGVVESKRIFVA